MAILHQECHVVTLGPYRILTRQIDTINFADPDFEPERGAFVTLHGAANDDG